MTDLPLLLAFIAAATVLTLTPGVDTAIVLRAAMAQGRRAAALAAAGIALGCLIWGAAVSLGLGLLLQASALAYTAVKLAGAAYLLWMGLQLLRQPRSTLSLEDSGRASSRDAFLRGFLTNLLNPKVGVFYVSFLPQFVPAGASVPVHTFVLASVHVALSLAWFALLIAALGPLGRWLRRPAALKTLDRLTGCIFVAFGLKLAASSAR